MEDERDREGGVGQSRRTLLSTCHEPWLPGHSERRTLCSFTALPVSGELGSFCILFTKLFGELHTPSFFRKKWSKKWAKVAQLPTHRPASFSLLSIHVFSGINLATAALMNASRRAETKLNPILRRCSHVR